MKLLTEITRQDYADFNTFHFVKTRMVRTIVLGLLALVILQLVLSLKEFNLLACVVSSVAYIAYSIFSVYRSLRRTKNAPDSNGTILGEKEYEFTDDGVHYKTRNSTGTSSWSSIKKMEEGSRAFYLYMDSVMAIIIPKKSFKDLDEMEAFKKLIQRKIDAQKRHLN